MHTLKLSAEEAQSIALKELTHGHNTVEITVSDEVFHAALQEADMLYSGLGESVEVSLDVHRHEDLLTVRGELAFEAKITCALCLAEVSRRYVLPLSWTMMPVRSLSPKRLSRDEEVELSAEDLEVTFYQDDEVDLLGLLREVLILEMEASPRCELDTCGAEAYGAPPDENPADEERIDPRWASLAALKGTLKR